MFWCASAVFNATADGDSESKILQSLSGPNEFERQAGIKSLLAASALVERLGSVPEEHLKTITEVRQWLAVQLCLATQ